MHVTKRPGPGAGALVAWGNAWLTGHVGLDEAVDAVERVAGPCVLDGETAEISLRRGLGELRVEGMTGLRLALPTPGDPLGLTGPPGLNSAAIEAGAAVLADLDGRCVGLLPGEDRRGSSYLGVRWTRMEARLGLPDVPSLAEADHQLTMAVREVTEALLTVDDVSGRAADPEIMKTLAALRESPSRGPNPPESQDGLAPGYPPRAHRVAALAGRLTVVVDLARALDGRNLNADQMRRRTAALTTLDRAVRRAKVAAHNSAQPARK